MKNFQSILLTGIVLLCFNTSKAQGENKVGHGWHFTHYFSADWNGDGTLDLVVRNQKGELYFYPFKDNTFYGHGGGTKVGHGWNFSHYFVGDWTGDGIPDLVVRTVKGKLLLYPFKNNTFYGNGGGKEIGSYYNYEKFLPGDWNNDGFQDLLVKAYNGDMQFYEFGKEIQLPKTDFSKKDPSISRVDYYNSNNTKETEKFIFYSDNTFEYYLINKHNGIINHSTGSYTDIKKIRSLQFNELKNFKQSLKKIKGGWMTTDESKNKFLIED